jgi:MipA family protein
MPRLLLALALASFLYAFAASTGRAGELPLWEAGFGAAGLSMPDYRGSDQQRGYLLPLPFLMYRGDILKLDEKGSRLLLFQSKRLELNVSADGGVPVKSSRNTAREGMSDLDATFQFGPSIDICVSADCNAPVFFKIRLPLRAVTALNFSRFYGIGYVLNPQATMDLKDPGQEGWNFGCAIGPLFATKKFHDYYYRVSAADSIPGRRPAYDARGGYSGSLVLISLSRHFANAWFGAFIRYDDLSGAVFADSPLMRTKHSVMAGFGFSWVLGRSRVLVDAYREAGVQTAAFAR